MHFLRKRSAEIMRSGQSTCVSIISLKKNSLILYSHFFCVCSKHFLFFVGYSLSESLMPLSLTLVLLRLFIVFKCSSYLKCLFSTGDVKSSMTASNSHSTALRSSSLRNAGNGKICFQCQLYRPYARRDRIRTVLGSRTFSSFGRFLNK